LNFSDSVERFVPQFADIASPPPSKAKVTLIQLATHTGGLAGDPEDAKPFQTGAVDDWKRSLLAAVSHTRFMADPGSMFSYSNVGYAFLGAALEAAAEMPYTRYLTQQVLTPLAMNDTVFDLSAEQRVRLARGWTITERGSSASESEAELKGRGYRTPAGGLFSTLDDMTRWLRFLMGEPNPKVFDARALANAQTRVVTSGARLDSGYGIGLQLRRYGDTVVRGHSGGVPGYQAEMYFDPERKFGILILRSAVFGAFNTDAILAAAFAPTR
jgi:CubicO group peptidase (beta-lactamase class C family)